jgi:hypothetical protein
MTRKHFKIMAAYVRDYRQHQPNLSNRQRRVIGDAIADAFAVVALQCSRRGFDRDRFMRACAVDQREQERLLS